MSDTHGFLFYRYTLNVTLTMGDVGGYLVKDQMSGEWFKILA
jgi:hypothetical protein